VSKPSQESNHNQSSNEKAESSQNNTKVSVCDIMKNSTSGVIRKLESQVPSYMQLYSDLYTKYLHSWDDLFGTCYMSEKEFFDKMGINQNSIDAFDKYCSTLSKNSTSQIEMSTNFLRAYVQMRISAIESFDKYMHFMMDYYAKMLGQFNASLTK